MTMTIPYMQVIYLVVVLLAFALQTSGFRSHAFASMPCTIARETSFRNSISATGRTSRSSLRMNFFEDAFRFFSNMNKEASAKHILMTGPEASKKLALLKEELKGSTDISAAFSELASKVSECPSANRGGNLGTFKPGMMVKEIDRVCFEKEAGVVHGPVETQFGSHLILITRRYEGENEKKQ